jgi:hypothetical protein
VNCKFNPRKCDDENMPTIDKTKHPKYGQEKGTRWKGPSPSKKKKPPTWADRKGNMANQVFKSPQSQGAYHIKRREERLKKHLA